MLRQLAAATKRIVACFAVGGSEGWDNRCFMAFASRKKNTWLSTFSP
jgi:hypothetical protein